MTRAVMYAVLLIVVTGYSAAVVSHKLVRRAMR